MTPMERIAYEEEYATVLTIMDGDKDWMEMNGWIDPRDLVDDEDDDLPPAAETILTEMLS